MSETATPDVLDTLAGLAEDSPVAALRRQRPDVVRFTQTSDEAIFSPKDDGGLTHAERAAAALRIATLLGDAGLQEHYAARLKPLDPDGALLRSVGAETPSGDARWTAALAHVDRVTTDPDSAKEQMLRAPNGVTQDVNDYWAAGKPYYDPGKITVPTLLIHAEWDADLPSYQAQAYFTKLVNAPYKRFVELGEGTHTVMMEKNRMQFFREIRGFLDEASAQALR